MVSTGMVRLERQYFYCFVTALYIYFLSCFRFFEAGGQGRVSNDFDLPLPTIRFPSRPKEARRVSKTELEITKPVDIGASAQPSKQHQTVKHRKK